MIPVINKKKTFLFNPYKIIDLRVKYVPIWLNNFKMYLPIQIKNVDLQLRCII